MSAAKADATKRDAADQDREVKAGRGAATAFRPRRFPGTSFRRLSWKEAGNCWMRLEILELNFRVVAELGIDSHSRHCYSPVHSSKASQSEPEDQIAIRFLAFLGGSRSARGANVGVRSGCRGGNSREAGGVSKSKIG